MRSAQGLHSEAMQAAFKAALAGSTAELERQLCRASGWPGGRLNLKLAAAFGVQVAATDADVVPLLRRFTDDDSAPNVPRVYLGVAAAYGWVACARAGRELEAAWEGIAELGADGRHPVRTAIVDALTQLATDPDGADQLVARATGWLDLRDRERAFGAMALALEVIGDLRVMAAVRDHDALIDYLERVIDAIGNAPRAAERSEMRRRALGVLGRAVATVVAKVPGERGQQWLDGQCEQASHPRVREALSDALVLLRTDAQRQSRTVADAASKSLAASAVPPRDPTRVRPGTGRGRASRRIR